MDQSIRKKRIALKMLIKSELHKKENGNVLVALNQIARPLMINFNFPVGRSAFHSYPSLNVHAGML